MQACITHAYYKYNRAQLNAQRSTYFLTVMKQVCGSNNKSSVFSVNCRHVLNKCLCMSISGDMALLCLFNQSPVTLLSVQAPYLTSSQCLPSHSIHTKRLERGCAWTWSSTVPLSDWSQTFFYIKLTNTAFSPNDRTRKWLNRDKISMQAHNYKFSSDLAWIEKHQRA